MSDRAELQRIIDLDTERFRELGEEIQELNKRIAELERAIKAVKGWLNKCEAEAFETANPFLMGAIGHALAEISEGGADE